MEPKSAKDLVAVASREIETISAEGAVKLVGDPKGTCTSHNLMTCPSYANSEYANMYTGAAAAGTFNSHQPPSVSQRGLRSASSPLARNGQVETAHDAYAPLVPCRWRLGGRRCSRWVVALAPRSRRTAVPADPRSP